MNAFWLKFLPYPMRKKLEGRHGLQAVLSNSGWMFADKILRMGMGLLVGVWVVRYLGPTQLGLLSYAGAFAGLFGSVATLGLDSLVIREMVKDPTRQDELLGTAFILKLIAGIATLIFIISAITIVKPGEYQTIWIVSIIAANVLLFPVNVIDMYFQAKVKSKYTVCSTICAFLLVTIAKILMILAKAPIVAFAWAALIESALTAYFLIYAYNINLQRIKHWKYEPHVARELLSQSWPLILSGLSIMLYMRMDQILIGQMLGNTEVGFFAAAVRISEMWYFVPMALASSLFPTIVESKKISEKIYYERLQNFFTVMVWIAIGFALTVTIFKDIIVHILYGSSYENSATVLAIHIWAGVFVALGVSSSSWYIVEHLQKLAFYRTIFGGLTNIGLNFLFIPRYGIVGSAASTVISQMCATLLFDFLNLKTRRIFWMKCMAIANPFPLLKILIKYVI